MMKRLLILLIVMAATSPIVFGETILIPVGRQDADVSESLPHRGMLKNDVRKMAGDPIKINPAVGEPPISSWEYKDFTVYFEYDHVIHAVKKYKPKHPEAIN